jgi:hypothetical protein
MSASSSASSFTSVPANVPSCDAWGNFNVGTAVNVALNDGSGISSVFRASSGVYGISFSNPQRFGGGAYVVMTTPEYSIDTGYGPVTVPPPNGRTGAGISAGLRINTYTYPNGFHPGGGTAALNDPPTGAYRVNVAAFSFATESDLRSSAVANWIKDSNFLSSIDGGAISATLTPAAQLTSIVQMANPTGTPTAVECTLNIQTTVGSNFSYVLQPVAASPSWFRTTPWTSSIFIKGAVGGEQIYISNVGGTKTLLTLTNTWKRYSVTGTQTTGIGLKGIEIGLQGSGLIPSTSVSATFYIQGAQLEPGSLMTEFVSTPVAGQSTSYTGTIGNQDARKRLVPGAQGFGVTGATYSSASANLLSKRTATAYGTIVIPPNKGNSAPVIAYIENGFNVKGVSAGANSLFDISFVKPMNNTNYCTILSGEYESTDTTALPEEFSLLLVRAGAGNKYKTTRGFRVEALRQNTANNSWTQQSVRYDKGFTQRIHFMVFGGGTYGQP